MSRPCEPLASLFGLAPGGVCRAVGVATRAVRSYRTISPLPAPLARHLGGIFLLHFPWAHAPQVLPGTLPDGARTFLHALARTATAWPTLGAAPYARQWRVNCDRPSTPLQLQRTLVGFVVARAGELRGELRGLLQRHSTRAAASVRDRVRRSPRRRGAGLAPSIDEHDLAAREVLVLLRARRESSASVAAIHRLVRSWSARARPRRCAVRRSTRAVLERIADSVRRFVEHQRARLACERARDARAAPRRAPAGIPRSRSDPVGSPATDSAAIAAHGPGTVKIPMPAAAAARTSA